MEQKPFKKLMVAQEVKNSLSSKKPGSSLQRAQELASGQLLRAMTCSP
jgi:hypothetical protein